MNPIFLYFIDKELEKYKADPEHYKSYEEWGKELDEEFERCIAELKKDANNNHSE